MRLTLASAISVVALACCTLGLPAAAQQSEPRIARRAAQATTRLTIPVEPPYLRVRGASVARQMPSRFAADAASGELAEGQPLWYDQNPRLLRSDHTGGLSFDNFLVAGDIETLTFDRRSVAADDGFVRETWGRVRTDAVAGRVVSVFNPSWDASALRDGIMWAPRGFNQTSVYFGTLYAGSRGEDNSDGRAAWRPNTQQFAIWLIVTPLNLPTSKVTRINDMIQYASHVVNIVMPDFGNSRLERDEGRDIRAAMQRFYEHFPDAYGTVAITTREAHVTHYGGWHLRVSNPVAGLGCFGDYGCQFDNTSWWGSGGTLRSIHRMRSDRFSHVQTATHETLHQWADGWDWSDLTGGVDFFGHEPSVHTPLLWPGETYVGAVLDFTRRVAAAEDGTFVIERTRGVPGVHPTTLYRMGLIGAEDVPEMFVFENQGQFNKNSTARPDPRTVIEGGYRRVHINDIIARHGQRRGPVEQEWRTAAVVVSRYGLLSGQEMSFWNFFTARLAATEGTTTPDGHPSFFEATGGRMRLLTDVTPKVGEKIVNSPPLNVSHVPIDPGEFRNVQLDRPLRASFAVGESVTIAGGVFLGILDQARFACVDWWPLEGEGGYECDRIVGGRFSVSFRFQHAGPHMLGVSLNNGQPGGLISASRVSGIVVFSDER